MIKGYVDENNQTLFVCPECGFQKSFSALPFKNKKKPLTIKCRCGTSTEMEIEFRQFFRKKVGLPGSCHIEKNHSDCEIIIRDISLGGVGIEFIFVNKKYLADIETGDVIFVEFKLDHGKDKVIRKRCIVRIKYNNIIGAEFKDENYTKELGFFMMH